MANKQTKINGSICQIMKSTKKKNIVGNEPKTKGRDVLIQIEWSGKAFLIISFDITI